MQPGHRFRFIPTASCGVFSVDFINRFKEVNDRYSHLTGDRVLEKVADLIRDNLRQGDLVIRYGGDEFLIVLPETEEKSENIESSMKDKLCEWNRENQLIDFPLTLAIGTSYWNPEQDKEIEKVLKEADRKMYETKGRR